MQACDNGGTCPVRRKGQAVMKDSEYECRSSGDYGGTTCIELRTLQKVYDVRGDME